jgi:hypothetical protein
MEEPDYVPTQEALDPIIPTTEKIIGSVDLGILVGGLAFLSALVVIRLLKARTKARMAAALGPVPEGD